ncbi:MAG TPA: winged helix-turn-helix domain-containing protein [Terracidiphilus sp.]|nr:winged helix-turn-helix domain-containing protein [Terracidiphilus sp.]
MVSELRGIALRFGPFELDTRSAELRNLGQKVPLQEQPFQILCLLTASPGELVTREDIRRRLWPDNTIVEFENAINAAIKKLRIALADSADEPRYIETVKRRGYRLMVPVEPLLAVSNIPQGAEPVEALSLESTAIQPTPAPATARHWKVAAGAAIVIGCLATGYAYIRRPTLHPRNLAGRDKIVLADFLNRTGDPVFDGTLRQGLRVQLEQSPVLSLISDERMQQALHLMGQAEDAPLTPETARQICARTGGAAVVDGSVTSIGSRYVLGLRARDCRSGEILAEEQSEAAGKEGVLNALGQIAVNLRTRMGETQSTINRYSTPLAQATTSSLDALKAYSEGFRVLSSSGSAAALPFFKHAIDIDPGFAMAYAHLGIVYTSMGESELALKSIQRAYELHGHVSEPEKFFISVSYHEQVTGNLELAQQVCEAWAQTYPEAMEPHGFLSGGIYPVIGRYDKSGEHGLKTIELDPDFAIGYNITALSYIVRDRLPEAENTLRQAKDRKLDIPDFFVDRFEIAFLKNDQAAMDRELSLSQGLSGVEDLLFNQSAFSFAYMGHLQQARRRSTNAAVIAGQSGQTERAALFEAGEAVREALFGNAAEAGKTARDALKHGRDKEVEYGAAFAFVLAGDAPQSKMIADQLEKRYPEDTSVKFSYMPTLRALLALHINDPAKAIDSLQIATPHELGTPQSADYGFFGALYPVYARGEAFLAARQGIEAAAEFQKIIDHPGVVVNDPIGALAHLQLARAQVLAGDRLKAKAAYQHFLTLWKSADPDIPILKQARIEFASLH